MLYFISQTVFSRCIVPHTTVCKHAYKLTTLHCHNIAYPAWRRQPLITNYSFTSEQVRKAVICAHNWPIGYCQFGKWGDRGTNL